MYLGSFVRSPASAQTGNEPAGASAQVNLHPSVIICGMSAAGTPKKASRRRAVDSWWPVSFLVEVFLEINSLRLRPRVFGAGSIPICCGLDQGLHRRYWHSQVLAMGQNPVRAGTVLALAKAELSFQFPWLLPTLVLCNVEVYGCMVPRYGSH